MKIALISDTHFGVRSDNINLLDHQKIFFDDIFFPYLKKNNIDTAFHLGDLVDRRKYINFNTLDRMKRDFLDPLFSQIKFMPIIAGNHDTYYKDRNELNSLALLLNEYKPVIDYNDIDPKEYEFDGTKILALPWICRQNESETIKAIKETKASACFGHLQLIGFEMHKGSFSEEGMSKDLFSNFHTVCSGHFHHKSDYGNIHYLGCPYQMNWGDYGDCKGFHIFDTKTHDLTFIPNPYSLFHKIEYDDSKLSLKEIMNMNFDNCKKGFVRVVVKEKTNSYWFDNFIERIEVVEPISIQVIEDMGNLLYDGEQSDLIHVEDTITLLSKYCEGIGVQENLKPKLNELLQSIYNEANNLRIA